MAQVCAFLDYGDKFMPEDELMEIALIIRRQIKQREDEREKEEVRSAHRSLSLARSDILRPNDAPHG